MTKKKEPEINHNIGEPPEPYVHVPGSATESIQLEFNGIRVGMSSAYISTDRLLPLALSAVEWWLQKNNSRKEVTGIG